jgi:hypothetical protein
MTTKNWITGHQNTGDQTGALLGAIAAVYALEGREAGVQAAAALRAAPAPVWPAGASVFAPLIALLLARAETPAARLLREMQDRLPWGENPVAGRLAADAPVIYSVATLMGPEGPVVCGNMRLGLFYQPPETYYGLHNHAAVETYAIVAGEMIWADGVETRLCRAGDFVHHASLQPHAFRTGAEGFLALWRWDGDIDVGTYRMLE